MFVCVCVRVQVRAFAAEATPEPTVEVPLKLFSLPGKYATALYTTATKEGNLKKVETDLKSVRTHPNTHSYRMRNETDNKTTRHKREHVRKEWKDSSLVEW